MAKMNTSRNRKSFATSSLGDQWYYFYGWRYLLLTFSQEARRNGIMEHGEVRIYLSENAAQVNEQDMQSTDQQLLTDIYAAISQ